jgi:ATPase subunit of ABC transporter with duplicated ATPase domains
MNIIFENLYKDYSGKEVFSTISGRINEGERVGLIGINGVGKTTLAKLLAGLEEYERGSIKYAPSYIKVVYMNQSLEADKESTVYKELYEVYKNQGQEDSKAAVEVEKTLNKMELKKEIWENGIHSLSGGEKTRLLLCRALAEDFDLLILDEPTNHLDVESIQWLEKFINKLNKTIIIISHDRYFLDKTTNKIWELSKDELREYEGNYSAYRVQKEVELRNTLREYDKQQAKIEHLEEIINERKNWFLSAHKAAGQDDFRRAKSKKHVSIMRAKEKELERTLENKIERPKSDAAACFEILNKNIINTKLPQYLIQISDLNKSFGDRTIFSNASFSLKRGDRTALVGSNGSGKSTLFKIICGFDKDYLGNIGVNPSVKIGYFAQELEGLNYEKSILDNVLYEGYTQGEARLLLACLLFRGDAVFKTVKHLSMGEKCRVAFAKLILSGANVLVLDEATNYMDIVSKEKLEDMLLEFQGSIVFVSHDRYFVKKLANSIAAIEDKKIVTYAGSYDDYMNFKEEKFLKSSSSFDYQDIKDNISKLECTLAFLSGRFNEKLTEEEKEKLNAEFIKTAREINVLKAKLITK